MVREVVRKRRQNDGSGSKKAAAAPVADAIESNEDSSSINVDNEDGEESSKVQSSIGKALSTRQTRKLQNRASLQAPYANLLSTTPGKNNTDINSPRTPLRTPRSATTKRQDLWDITSPASPKSPSMRALNAIVSFISPYASARRSAAFGEPEEEQEEQDRSTVWKGKQKEDPTALVEEDEDENEEDDIASSLYPPLPSDPNSSLQAITKNDLENDTTIIEQTIDQIEEDDEESGEVEESDDVEEQEQASLPTQTEDDNQSQPSEADVVILEEDLEIVPPPKSVGLRGNSESRAFSFSAKARPNPTFGAPSAVGLAVSEEQSTQNLGESTNVPNNLPLLAARSPFQSNGFVAPRQSTPSKTGFGAIANEPLNSTFKPAPSFLQPELQQSSVIPPSSAFTFGTSQEASTSRLPQYPRITRPTKTISPLAKNYELLARFFAEKAEQETRGEASISISSMDEDGNEQTGALTEIELAGCMRLIEQSYAQGQGEEVERLRHDALRRGQAPQILGENSMDNRMDEDEVHFANSHVGHNGRHFISRSPSLPLGAAAGEAPVAGLYGYRSRPSSSFLAPTYRDPQDVRVNQSLANIFGNSATVPPKRKHRPLYLGPGVGATATSAILKRNQQTQARRSALTTQRASLREQLRPLPVRATGRTEVAEDLEDNEGPRKRRKLPEESVPVTASATTTRPINQKSPEQAKAQAAINKTPVSRTATADAMLSILSSGPSIPSRSKAGSNTMRASTAGASEADSSSNPQLINPYESRSRLRTRSAAPTSINSSSTAATKEKERLKEEREKRLKAEKEREARKESTLDFIKRTAPTPHVRRGRQIRLEEDDEEEEEQEVERESEKAAAAEVEAKEKAKVAEENRKRKNEELKKRMEKLNKDAQSKDSRSDGAEPKQSSQPTSSSIPASKSFSFNSGFAPKKPSPLSQAASNHVPDSPSASSESSERSNAKTIASPQKVNAWPPASSTIVIDDDDDGEEEQEEAAVPEAPKPKAPLFNFGSTTSSAASKDISTPAPTFNFATKAPESTSASTSKPSTPAPFTFGKPVESATPKDSTAPSIPASASAKSASGRDQVSNAPISTLPKFDFTLDVVLPESSDKPDEATRKSVISESVASLPKFDFGGSSIVESAAPIGALNKTFSFSAPKPAANTAPPPAFAFKPISSATSAATPVSKDVSETSAEPGSGATSGDESGSASDKNKSALLSGTGEGEEEESSLHEVRCKIWNLSDGKWNDLGIGSLKIKKHKTTSKQRVLVRNEGNGKVTVNFNIMSTFKPTQDKNIVTFLGFDQSGKPTNYRCKIKTEGDAKDLKEALEKSAKDAA